MEQPIKSELTTKESPKLKAKAQVEVEHEDPEREEARRRLKANEVQNVPDVQQNP